MIQIDIFDGESRSFWTRTRGSSEAVSQALLFMVIISTAAGISIVGGDLLDDVQGEESFNQAIISFENLDETIYLMNSMASANEFTTAAQAGTVRSINAELHRQEPTVIAVDSGGGYEIETRPLTVRNLDYDVTYDAGIVQSRTADGVEVVQTPADRSRLNANVLSIPSIQYADDAQFRAGNSQPVLISQQTSPEVLSVTPGTTLTVTTEQPQGWEAYFESHSQLTGVTVDSGVGGSTPVVEAQVAGSEDLVLHVDFILLEPTSR